MYATDRRNTLTGVECKTLTDRRTTSTRMECIRRIIENRELKWNVCDGSSKNVDTGGMYATDRRNTVTRMEIRGGSSKYVETGGMSATDRRNTLTRVEYTGRMFEKPTRVECVRRIVEAR